MKTQNFIRKAEAIHKGLYTYEEAAFANTKTKVKITCREHGVFEQTPDSHINQKQGCPKCRIEKIKEKFKLSWDEVEEGIKKIHGDRYEIPPNQKYINNNSKITLICKEHGKFSIRAASVTSAGQGCRICGINRSTELRTGSVEYFKGRLTNKFYKKYDYDFSTYITMTKPVRVRCKKHNQWFNTIPHEHIKKGISCARCKSDKLSDIKSLPFEDLKYRVKCMYGDTLKLKEETYKKSQDLMTIFCTIKNKKGEVHGDFLKRPNDLLAGHGCNLCSTHSGSSKKEIAIRKYITDLGIICKKGNSETLKKAKVEGVSEIDIIIPKYKVAIEFNGLYWHSEKFKEDKKAHLKKSEALKQAGYKLIHIWEDDWDFKQDLIKHRLKNLLGKAERIYARKCQVREVSPKETADFLDKFHLQGRGTYAKINLGLFYEEQIQAVMTFSKPRFSKSFDWEMLRFCSDKSVTGGFSKLLSHFKKEHKGSTLVTYADRCWGEGEVYEKTGFKFEKFTEIGYWWVKGLYKYSRFEFMKHKLSEKLDIFDEKLSEVENCQINGYKRIFDCGNSKWRMGCLTT